MKTNNQIYVNMEHVIGHLATQYGVPILSFDNLTELGRRAVVVYGLADQAKRITFADLCTYITAYIKTPFGAKSLKELSQ